jgi:Spy/CpxP family protein refolding chaperone
MAYRALKTGVLRAAVLLIGGLAVLSLGSDSGSAMAQSIYDSRVQHRLELTPQQRPQVNRIVEESKRQAMAVFKKYGIDPNGRPIFDQLFQASNELMAIERQERQAMKQVLTPEQLADYDRIIDDTRIRVRKAAQ